MKICIVSPHLDDALLSCGVLMQRRRAAGDEILVANIFTAGTDAEERRQEEKRAQAGIGARPFFLDELDAPDRDPQYKQLKNIFFGPLEKTAGPFIDKVAGRLDDFFTAHAVEAAYFPLGAGTHIDHRIAFEAGRRLSGRRIRFYEDRPYILWPGVLQGRMNQIGCDAALHAADMPPVTGKTMKGTVGAYHFLTHFVPEGAYQALGHFVPEGDYRLETMPLYIAALDPPGSFRLKGKEETLAATESELKTLYACLAQYGSRMGSIYKDCDNFIHDSLAYERAVTGNSVYTERCWSLEPLERA